MRSSGPPSGGLRGVDFPASAVQIRRTITSFGLLLLVCGDYYFPILRGFCDDSAVILRLVLRS